MQGKPVPDFSLPSTGGSTFKLSSARRNTVVLYFKRALSEVPGSSRDALASHERFKEKLKFPFELLADPEEAVCKQFGVIKMKSMYGKKVRGIERSTLVIGSDGVLAREWRGVKVPGHVQEVLNFVKAL